jgi:prepilin-type N-terminal cleavage/methylation domain-containing protein
MCAVTSSGRRRRAFTLIEMLVVMGIILLLATIGVAYLPKMSDNQKRTRAVDLVSQWLLTAKERAKRDRLPTGVRFIDPNNPSNDPTKPILVSQLQYVQQPDPITGGQLVYYASASAPAGYFGPIANNIYVIGGICLSATPFGGTGAATIVTFGNVDFTSGTLDQRLVQRGDYLELGGSVHLIVAVSPPTTTTGTQVYVWGSVSLGSPTTNYRIFRQPRPLVGEDILQLPPDMVIDIGKDPISGNLLSRNVPQRSVVDQNGNLIPVNEILFSPSGEVIGTGTSGGKVLLWVRDSTVANPYDPAATAIVSIQTRTGLIAAQPVAPGNDPYANTEDARSSGM